MTRMLPAALFVLFALPGVARAGEATLVTRELPLGAVRAPAAAGAPARFNLVGLHWQGSGTVRFRTRRLDGRWRSWEAETDESPDAGSAEHSRRRGWRLGEPYWTGPSDRIEYRTIGRVRRLRAHFVWSAPERVPLRQLSVAGSPAILPRAAWGANEALRRGFPAYAPALRFAAVHHTAGSSGYSPAAAAAIVRAIQTYHVKGNGWNDIGYNFLVDRFGRVFEGRRGGVARNVVGAHAGGFNAGSVGVAVIGSHARAPIGARARSALVNLLAWRLDVAHVNPLSTLTFTSAGNARFPTGAPVFLRAISGHRDTGFTSCPGGGLYGQLNTIATAVARTGLPKLYEPAVRDLGRGRVRFSARLSSTLPWTVTVSRLGGGQVAARSGFGTVIAWTWDAKGVPAGRYRYVMRAGPGARAAAGVLRRGRPTAPPPARSPLSRLRATPATITPNGDGVDDSTTVSYVLGVPGVVTASVIAPDGTTVATLFSRYERAGGRVFTWTPVELPDGVYTLALTLTAEGEKPASASTTVTLDRTAPPELPPAPPHAL